MRLILKSYKSFAFGFSLLFFFLNPGIKVYAQQDPLFTQYMFNPLVLNPAYAGSREVPSIALICRAQWTGIDGAPKTNTLSINSPLKNKKIGIGMHLINDRIAAYQVNGVLGSFAYRVNVFGEGKLSLGLRGGLYNYKFNWNELEYKNKADYVNSYSQKSRMVPTVDFGMYYFTHTLYAGFCLSHLNNPQFTPKLSGNDTIVPKSKLVHDFNAVLGKAFVIDDKLTFRPSVLVHSTSGAAFIDLNTCFLLREKIWLGMGFRTTKALMFLFEYNFPTGFRLGYSFEFMQNRLQTMGKQSHELFLGWDLIRYKQKTYSLRYF